MWLRVRRGPIPGLFNMDQIKCLKIEETLDGSWPSYRVVACLEMQYPWLVEIATFPNRTQAECFLDKIEEDFANYQTIDHGPQMAATVVDVDWLVEKMKEV